ncbi:hypothetical protein JCM8097_007071 [Rhodosporidiobolus ruineniae]
MLRSVAARTTRGCSRLSAQAPRLASPAPAALVRALSSTPHRLASSGRKPLHHSLVPEQTQPCPTIIQSREPKTALHLQMNPKSQTHISYMWLRDHCREERSYHPKTKQRLVDTYKIPPDIKPDAVEAKEEGLYVTWPKSDFESSYTSFYPWSFLVEHAYNPPLVAKTRDIRTRKTHWTAAIKGRMPTQVTYEQVMDSEKGVYEWLKLIDTYGFAFVSGVPHTPEATEQLIRRIAFIRETHYGGFWDFTANLEHGDLAYSEVKLEGHTDTTYFTDPCGLQLFHLLSDPSTHTGGQNLLIDGFRAAHLLKLRHPNDYEFLAHVPTPSHASGSGSASSPSGVHMRPMKQEPLFIHNETGELVQVRWNMDDRGALGGHGMHGRKMEKWYKAMREWERILRNPESQLWTQMEPGTAIIFDNHRVLHGRSAFSGTRRLCGAYISGDDYRSRLRGLEKQFGSVTDKSVYHLERKVVNDAMRRHGVKHTKKEAVDEAKREVWGEYLS